MDVKIENSCTEANLLRPNDESKCAEMSPEITPPFDQNRLVRQSWFLAIGAVGIFAAYSGVVGLQSSLNFEESLGTTSLAICFGTTIVLNATLVPAFFHNFGAKFLLLVSDLAFIVFTFANLYPAKFTLYPAAICLGVGEAFIWPAITMFNAQFGMSYVLATRANPELASVHAGKNEKFLRLVARKTRWFTGKFFAIFSTYQIIGNLVAYSILFSNSGSTQGDSTDNITAEVDLNTTHAELQCGSSDCYEYLHNDTDEGDNLDVADPVLRYVLFAVYAFLQICSMVFHKILLREPARQEKRHLIAALKAVPRFQAKILRHMLSPLQILLVPVTIYNGMAMGFIFGDVTRSYIACPLGVEQVGLAMAFFGLSAAVGSFVFQWTSSFIGKNYFFTSSVALELSLLAIYYFWQPMGGRTAWQIYALTAAYGLPDAVRQAVISVTYAEYFWSEQGVAFSMMSMLCACGFSISFAIGTSICVFTKITILSSALVLSTLCYLFSELYFRKINQGR